MAPRTNVPAQDENPQVNTPTQEVVDAQVEEQVDDILAQFDMKSFTDVVKQLRKDFGKPIKRTVKNINHEVLDTYTRVSFTLREPVKAYQYKDDDFVLTGSNIIFTSIYAVAGMLKENDDLAFLANDIIANPKLLNLLVIAGQIEIIQQEVKEGEEYVNPFSSNPEPTTFEHDVIINHIISLTPGKVGLKFVDKYMDKMMDID